MLHHRVIHRPHITMLVVQPAPPAGHPRWSRCGHRQLLRDAPQHWRVAEQHAHHTPHPRGPCLRCDTVTMVRTVACKRGYKASLLRMGRIRLVVSYPKDGVFLEHEFVFQRVRASDTLLIVGRCSNGCSATKHASRIERQRSPARSNLCFPMADVCCGIAPVIKRPNVAHTGKH